MEQLDPFEEPRKPYIENLPIDHLKQLLDYFESIKRKDLLKKTKIVKCEEAQVIAWIEKSFEKMDPPGDGPQSLNEKLPKVHFTPPGIMK